MRDRSDSADGPGITYALRGYFDNMNRAVETRTSDPGESYGDYLQAFETFSGRLKKSYGSFEEFRQDRLDVEYAKVRLLNVRRVDEVTDSAEVNFERTVTKDGKDRCTYYHYRFQVRLATGSWALDDRKDLRDNGTRC